jgi:hypothetical protein
MIRHPRDLRQSDPELEARVVRQLTAFAELLARAAADTDHERAESASLTPDRGDLQS